MNLLSEVVMVNKSTKINIHTIILFNSSGIYEVLMEVMSSPPVLYTGMIK